MKMDVGASLSAISREVHAAKNELLRSIERYDTEGRTLLSSAAVEVERFEDPASNHSERARDDAREVLTHLQHGMELSERLSISVSMMLLALDSAISRLTLSMMTFPQIDAAVDPGHLKESWEEARTKSRKAIDDPAVLAIVFGREVSDLLAASADLLDARLDVTEQYLDATSDELPPPTTRAATTAFTSVMINGAEMSFEQIVSQALPRALEHIPVVGIAMTGVEIVHDIRKEAAEARQHQVELRAAYHARNERDDMDDFDASLLRQDDGSKRLSEILDNLATILANLGVPD